MIHLLAQAEPVGGPVITGVKWAIAAPCLLVALVVIGIPAVLFVCWAWKRVRESNK